jgi:hypothetical protein
MNRTTCLLTAFFCIVLTAAKAQSFIWSTLGNNDITPDNWLGTGNTSMLKDIVIKTDNKERMRIKGGGFFGIGISNPSNIVHIHNPVNTPTINEAVFGPRNSGGPPASTNSESPYFGSTGLQITNVESGTGINDGLHIGLRNGMVQGIRLNAVFNLKEKGDMQFFTDNSHRMTISRNGNVGIGIVNPVEKLDVAAKIRACEVILEQNNWCDYVFDANYNLKSLDEVEQFIKQNKHLPNIPPAGEIAQNGIAISDMTQRIMEKIEELTLYVIQQQKEIEQLKQKIKAEEK